MPLLKIKGLLDRGFKCLDKTLLFSEIELDIITYISNLLLAPLKIVLFQLNSRYYHLNQNSLFKRKRPTFAIIFHFR